MKKLIYIFTCLIIFNSSAQSYWFKFGFEHLNGNLPEISNVFTKDSYKLTNYPTLHFNIVDEDEITEVDMSMFSFALMGIAMKDENGKPFAGYNNTTKSINNFNVVQNRTLFELSNTKFKSASFHKGKQIGFDVFGAGDGVKKFGLTNNDSASVNPGSYASRVNMYFGLNYYYVKDFGKLIDLKIGTTINCSVSLVSAGISASPQVKLGLNTKFLKFNANLCYDLDYYYGRTQSYYKNSTINVSSKTVLHSALRLNFGVAIRVKNN